MGILRVTGALLLTVLMLFIASRASRGKPEFVSHSQNGYTFDMMTVPKHLEYDKARINVTITGPLSWSVRPVLRYARSGKDSLANWAEYNPHPIIMADSTTGSYFSEISTGQRGQRLQYYMQIVDRRDSVLATFMAPNEKPFVLKFIGDVPRIILISHIFFIFATVFCVAMAAIHAIPVLRKGASPCVMLRYLMWGAIFTFIGGYPFGFPMNWYAFNGIWEGVPFGTDATDNKTQLLLVYLLFATAIGLGTVSKGKYGRDVFSSRMIGWFGLGSLAVMLFIYLIPHSIQFSASLTYTFCYSFIGLWALVYLAAWIASRKKPPVLERQQPPQKVYR